jgi:cobyrinic acid a,c-diamide synthase
LPSRHLGLIQAGEIGDLEARIQGAAAALQGFPELEQAQAPAPIELREPEPQYPARELDGLRIAIARDGAFAFLYRANLDLLRWLGAELCFFSPLDESALPGADALYFPGGYPELHLDRLGANRPMKEAVRVHHAAGRPILAECGGMLYLLESLTDAHGRSAEMVGILPGHARMQERLANLGVHSIALPQGEIRGHTFHYSRLETPMLPVARSEGRRPGQRGEPAYREGALHASYMHLYFPSNPRAVAGLFSAGTGGRS